MKAAPSLFALCSLVFLVGCGDIVDSTLGSSDTRTPYNIDEALPMGPLSKWESSLSPEDRQTASVDIFERVSHVYDQVDPFVAKDTPLIERDLAARRALELADQERPEVQSVIGQSVSTTMVRLWLSEPNPPADRLAPYVEQLLAHENPNADIVRDGLVALKGTWSEAEMGRS